MIDLRINDNKKLVTIFFISIIFYLLNYLDVNKIGVMILIILFFVFYDKFIKNAETIFLKKKKDNEYYNNNIEEILYELKNLESISPYKYKEGYRIWEKFVDKLHKLESEKLYNYNHHFDNANLYLKDSCNIFMGITVGGKERKYIDAMEYGDFENTKELNKGSELVKRLYKEGNNLLYNLSLRLNEKWEKDPNIHNKEIVFNSPEPHDYKNKNKYNYDFF